MSHSGIRRNHAPGQSGRSVQVLTNCFEVKELPKDKFFHYDGFGDDAFNRRRKLEIIDKLQIQHSGVFNPRAVFDGERNMFRSAALPLPNNYHTFPVSLSERKVVDVTIRTVAQIDPRSLRGVITGQRQIESQDFTSLTLLNVLVRMKPIMTNPANARSFFIRETRNGDIKGGLELWRGYFQSVRLSIDRLTLNLDISTAVMYQAGSLVSLAMAYLKLNNPIGLNAKDISESQCRQLERFLKGLLVTSKVPGLSIGQSARYRPIRSVIRISADQYTFDMQSSNGYSKRLTVTEYFYRVHNHRLDLGKAICIGLSKDVVYPIEVLTVKEGQFYKRTLSENARTIAVKFATQRPDHRLDLIKKGSNYLGHHQSDFLSGMTIASRPMTVPARVLAMPDIHYKPTDDTREDILVPSKGAWNVLGRQLAQPGNVKSWAVVLFAPLRQEELDRLQNFLFEFVKDCRKLGISFPDQLPPLVRVNPALSYDKIAERLESTATPAQETFGSLPTFLLVILPDSAGSVLSAVKHWGDCVRGCPTQCLRIGKVKGANNQYRNNVALKLNMRIGGINWIPQSPDLTTFARKSPVMIIGADISHGGPGTNTPSISGLVGSVDMKMCRYVAITNIQRSHEERIMDMETMITHLLSMFQRRLRCYPERILFYRDGLSEGQLDSIARPEVDMIKAALRKLNIESKLTYLVVGKRHHVRFFPWGPADSDPSGNCLPGLVVDRDIVHPIQYDFFLQSHAGLLGTSRAGHYTLVIDENQISSDALHNISYAFCHSYGRATRSVSIPAPVYYADLVCRRGKFHSLYLRDGGDSYSVSSGENMSLEEHKEHFKPVHPSTANLMYWV